MSKITIAVVCGGFSKEYPVSIKSADGILSWIDNDIFDPYKVVITKDRWFVETFDGEIDIDKTDFSFFHKGKKKVFEYAYITIHGTPGEDGVIQGYFDLIGIRYNTAGVLQEALTFNKYFCNKYLSTLDDINIAKSVIVTKNNRNEMIETIKNLDFPVFVKPNTGGSSFATTKVYDIQNIEKALNTAFEDSQQVIVEEFIAGVEVTCGCYKLKDRIHALPVTEVIPQKEFFDFNAKYNGEVEEITPARIGVEMTDKVQTITKNIYSYLNLKGIIRVDFIIKHNGTVCLLEVNTTPGMTPTSFIPQQITADGKSISNFLTAIILDQEYK